MLHHHLHRAVARHSLHQLQRHPYRIAGVFDALHRAIERGVQVSLLLERSKDHGGNVSVDSVATLRRDLPLARLYEWDKAAAQTSPTASVHAKCAVADGAIAFITSANLSEAAMDRNMEVGVLLRGGTIPDQLERHLRALIATKQIAPL